MATLLQSPPNSLSIADVRLISEQLADELSTLHWHSEGFSVDDYLSLNGNYLVEYMDGCLQVLPMPDGLHQALVGVLWILLDAYASSDPNARCKFSPFKIRLSQTQLREPDICYMKGKHASRRDKKFWLGADFVVEIVSESNRDHDYSTKIREYASAGIPEYWIVDPDEKVIRTFVLSNTSYSSAGTFGVGDTAKSLSLDNFKVDVAELFSRAAARE